MCTLEHVPERNFFWDPSCSTFFQRDMTNHSTTAEENMHYPAEWKDHLFDGTLEGIGRAPGTDLPSIDPTPRNSDGLISSRIFHRWQGVRESTMKPEVWQTTPPTMRERTQPPYPTKRNSIPEQENTASLLQRERNCKFATGRGKRQDPTHSTARL